MPKRKHNAPSASPAALAPEVTEIQIEIHDGSYIWYAGTRAQLEAEGIVPAGVLWPEEDDNEFWTAGDLRFRLSRGRPKGFKGTKKAWVQVDHWTLFIHRLHRDFDEIRIEQQRAALRKAIWEVSPAGKAAWSEMLDRHWAARQNEKFQAFKASIPALAPRAKRGNPMHDDCAERRSTPESEARHG